MQQETISRGEDPIYVPGRAEAETQRLIQQSRLLNPFTQRLLEEAGLEAGMKVLDLGSGAGCVALLATELVGPKGSVVGVDANPAVLRTARARARAAGLTNVTFVEGDVRTVALEDDFDAVVGRWVLIYLADPTAALRALARRLKPDGIVAFQEWSNLTPASLAPYPPTPLWQRCWGWIRTVAQQAGVETEMGYKLRLTYLAAGLPAPGMRLESAVGGEPDWGGYSYVAETLRSLLPLVLEFGIATAEEVEIDTLAERLREEAVRCSGVVKLPDLVGAWARMPQRRREDVVSVDRWREVGAS